jgi:hypothetical protein
MFNVSTIYLDSDMRHAAVQHGTVKRGELAAAEFTQLLENFLAIDAMETVDTDPQVIATRGDRTVIIRTVRKKLFVYNAKNMNESAVEMTPAEILQRLGAVQAVAAPEEETKEQLPPGKAAVPLRNRKRIGYLLLVGAVLVNVYTVYSNFFGHEHMDVAVSTDAGAIAQQQRAVAGTYDGPGSHILIIGSDGTLKYGEVETSVNPVTRAGKYSVGTCNKGSCLLVDDDSVIIIIDNNTLVYRRDIFHRVK